MGFDGEFVRVSARNVEQIVDHLGELIGVLDDYLEMFAPARGAGRPGDRLQHYW